MMRRARGLRVLVVYKKDAYLLYLQEQRDPRLVRLLSRQDPDVLDVQRAHAVHEEAMEMILHALRRSRIPFDLAYRATLRVRRRYDLVVSVGGDGTFLQAAHAVGSTP